MRCPTPPSSVLPREAWELEVFKWGAECAALHGTCVDELSAKVRP